MTTTVEKERVNFGETVNGTNGTNGNTVNGTNDNGTVRTGTYEKGASRTGTYGNEAARTGQNRTINEGNTGYKQDQIHNADYNKGQLAKIQNEKNGTYFAKEPTLVVTPADKEITLIVGRTHMFNTSIPCKFEVKSGGTGKGVVSSNGAYKADNTGVDFVIVTPNDGSPSQSFKVTSVSGR